MEDSSKGNRSDFKEKVYQKCVPSLAGHHGGHFSVETGTAILFRLSRSTSSLTLRGTAGKT